MRKYLSLLATSLVTVLLCGCGADQAVKKGDKFYALGEYFDAATQYRKAYSQTPPKERALRGQRALKMAECYHRINYTQKAIAAYNNAVRYKQHDSLTYLYLGQQLMKNGSYKEAAKAFQTFLDSTDISHSPGSAMEEGRFGLYGEAREPLQLATCRLLTDVGGRGIRPALLHVYAQPGQR